MTAISITVHELTVRQKSAQFPLFIDFSSHSAPSRRVLSSSAHVGRISLNLLFLRYFLCVSLTWLPSSRPSRHSLARFLDTWDSGSCSSTFRQLRGNPAKCPTLGASNQLFHRAPFPSFPLRFSHFQFRPHFRSLWARPLPPLLRIIFTAPR